MQLLYYRFQLSKGNGSKVGVAHSLKRAACLICSEFPDALRVCVCVITAEYERDKSCWWQQQQKQQLSEERRKCNCRGGAARAGAGQNKQQNRNDFNSSSMIQAEIRAVQVQSVYWIPERHYVPLPPVAAVCLSLTHSLTHSISLSLALYPCLSVVVVICLFDWTNWLTACSFACLPGTPCAVWFSRCSWKVCNKICILFCHRWLYTSLSLSLSLWDRDNLCFLEINCPFHLPGTCLSPSPSPPVCLNISASLLSSL